MFWKSEALKGPPTLTLWETPHQEERGWLGQFGLKVVGERMLTVRPSEDGTVWP